jgi:hypothetical protein
MKRGLCCILDWHSSFRNPRIPETTLSTTDALRDIVVSDEIESSSARCQLGSETGQGESAGRPVNDTHLQILHATPRPTLTVRGAECCLNVGEAPRAGHLTLRVGSRVVWAIPGFSRG